MALGRLTSALRLPFARISPVAATRAGSWWSNVEEGPPDAIFGLVDAYNKDSRSPKVNLTVGAYRDDQGKPLVLKVVKEIEQEILNKQGEKEYAGILGYPAFHKAAAEFALTKEERVIKENLYVSAQAIGGTGAVRLIGQFLAKFYPYEKTIYVSNPTWGNHTPIFKHAGLDVKTFRYYKPETCGFDSEACYEDLRQIPDHSIILLHPCGHNPSGIDPTLEEWTELSRICKEKQHFIVMDMAYQGFASGDLDRDAQPLRMFIREGHQVAYAQSFSKNIGLYGERVGAMTIVVDNEKERKAVESQVKIIIRPLYSNPPIHGARVTTEVLSNPQYYSKWVVEMKTMADRISSMRTELKKSLEDHGSTHDWSHVTKQIGMFCYSGLSPEQVEKLRTDFAVYLTKDGRISIPGLFSSNVGYVAKAIHEVTK